MLGGGPIAPPPKRPLLEQEEEISNACSTAPRNGPLLIVTTFHSHLDMLAFAVDGFDNPTSPICRHLPKQIKRPK